MVDRQLLWSGMASLSFSALTILFGLAKLQKKPSPQDHPFDQAEQDDQQQINQQHAQLQQSRQMLLSLSHAIKVPALQPSKISYSQQGILTKPCLFQFCRKAIQSITEKQVCQVYYQNRRIRRPCFPYITVQKNNAQQYFKYVCMFDNDIQFLIEKSQKDLAVFLDLAPEVVPNTIEYYLVSEEYRFRNQLSQVTIELREAIKKKLPHKNVVDEETLRKIIKLKTQILRLDEKKILNFIKGLELEDEDDQSYTPSFLYLYVHDKIFESFNVEEQDISQGYKNMTSTQIRDLAKQFRTAQNHLMGLIIDATQQ